MSGTIDQWKRLQTYRQRYQIEDRLGALVDLEKSLNRRRIRSAALSRRLTELLEMVEDVRGELATIESEISGSRDTGALLIEQIIEEVRREMGEAWSPTPVKGLRMWRLEGNKVMGAQVHWPSPTLVGECFRDIPGGDVPHPASRCGPPACGIYAVKDVDMFGHPLSTKDSVVGVVAMTGKVVEHERGYRASAATVIAVVADDGRSRLATTDPEVIEALFDDPSTTLAEAGAGNLDNIDTKGFLEPIYAMEEQWI
ncbi:MAG: hypothetical protein PVF87_12505 [Acidimicrobiia bacterium]|jgi:hypothetical protein